MDGYQAAREIKGLGYPGVLVGVTANALTADVEEFLAQGVQGVVTKPVNVSQLLDVIEQHITLPSASTTPHSEA
jgi:CheY-like chemotaxis protein